MPNFWTFAVAKAKSFSANALNLAFTIPQTPLGLDPVLALGVLGEWEIPLHTKSMENPTLHSQHHTHKKDGKFHPTHKQIILVC